MPLIANPSAALAAPDDLLVPDSDPAAVATVLIPFEVLGEPIVPGLTQVPLVLQGIFIQITNTSAVGSATLQLTYLPTVPFVVAPPGGKIQLAANLIGSDLSISNITPEFANRPGRPTFGRTIPPGGTIIVGVEYVATGLGLASQGVAATESAANRGSVLLQVNAGTPLLVTATIRQYFVSQTGNPLVPIAAAAYSVAIPGGPVVGG
ncbi:hypothetical protein [Methylobacterium sp. WSM2598]|uniref:hypothetical protein n=1 Tax=Methylobacterium sp. WSM2598 TaxID=398261 RepID=UPI0003829D30|nr:hypothetical protein [Methylobacterium sp. WSM2598]